MAGQGVDAGWMLGMDAGWTVDGVTEAGGQAGWGRVHQLSPFAPLICPTRSTFAPSLACHPANLPACLVICARPRGSIAPGIAPTPVALYGGLSDGRTGKLAVTGPLLPLQPHSHSRQREADCPPTCPPPGVVTKAFFLCLALFFRA